MRIVVFHTGYGCETGCCGHAIAFVPDDWPEDGDRHPHFMLDQEQFFFRHPYGEDPLAFARKLVAEECGPEHVADLDWAHCLILED